MKRSDIDPMPKFYDRYINLVEDVDVLEALEIHSPEALFSEVDLLEALGDSVYAPGKWTIKDIIQHLIDCERVFSYRAMRLGRNDQTQLVSFDENEYATQAGGNLRTIQNLLTELSTARQSTLLLYKSFTAEQLHQQWESSNSELSLAALGFVIIGHQQHHRKIFEERYL